MTREQKAQLKLVREVADTNCRMCRSGMPMVHSNHSNYAHPTQDTSGKTLKWTCRAASVWEVFYKLNPELDNCPDVP
jgi:hypothetical protein